jgi:hypothetical protein
MKDFIYLLRELASWRKNESEWLVGLGALPVNVMEKCEPKSESLSRSGLSATQNVTACDGIRNGRCLDWKWDGYALVVKRSDEIRMQAKVLKGGFLHSSK